MSENVDARSWYNQFASNQVKTGLNLRHYTIMNKCIDYGLKPNSSVLEIGCGVGTLTSLLARVLKNGRIVATDISDESVEIAKKSTAGANDIEFYVHNMQDFDIQRTFDFVILPDVMEHIPVSEHPGVFKSIARHMHDNSLVLINSPHPKALDHIRENFPERMQVIDQSLNAGELIAAAQSAGLNLVDYHSYGLYIQETDYTFVVFRKDLKITYTPKSVNDIRVEKMKQRMRLLL